MLNRRQRHHPGDRPAEGPRPGPAQAHADLLHGRAAVPARARVPALPVRGGPRAHGAGPAAESVRDPGKTETELTLMIHNYFKFIKENFYQILFELVNT